MGTTHKISYVDKDNFPYATGKINTQLIDYNAIKRDGKAFPDASLTKGWIYTYVGPLNSGKGWLDTYYL